MKCPKCQETTHQRKCGKTVAGSQRYSCKHCEGNTLPSQKNAGYPDDVGTGNPLDVDGMNYRRIARHLQVHNTTVINWVKAFAAQLPDAPMPEELKAIELDELFTFIETKKNAST